MEITPFFLAEGVLLSVKLEDKKLAFWSEIERCWTTNEKEATYFESQMAALTHLAMSRKKLEAAFLKRSGGGWTNKPPG